MANPQVIFLDQPGSLADQVAGVLLEGLEGHPYDLTSTEVWVPTAGAARRIRHSLATLSSKRGGGVLSPKFSSPMKALLPKGRLASRGDREASWGLVLQGVEQDQVAHLFPRTEVLEGEASILGTAGMMCDLCDLLADGGLVPSSPVIREVCSDDGERWEELAPLYRRYLDELKRGGLWDPNEARIKAWEEPVEPISSLTIACIPDLTEAAKRKAESVLRAGIPVRVLVWKPDPSGWGGGFDGWGRPITKEWLRALIPLSADQIVMAKDPAEEASKALEFLAGAGGEHALVLGDPELAPAFRAEVQRRGGSPFLPDGEPLAHTEAALVASGWIEFRAERSLRTLRRLLELPRFAVWIGRKVSLPHTELLQACDAMHLELLFETLPEGELPVKGIRKGKVRTDAERLAGALRPELAKHAREIVSEIWKEDPAEEVLEAFEESSPLLLKWPDPAKAREAMIVRTLTRKRSFGTSSPGDLDLSGWLEAPWVEAKRLALCGCTEGSLPASTDAHPFLPDGKRRALGVPDNDLRRARDAYILGCLVRSRPEGEFRCSFSKFGPDGSPSVPSALMMRCPEEDLPSRVKALFDKAPEETAPPVRSHGWKWSLPRVEGAPGKINVTDFKSYLECPFRFYLSRRADLQDHDPEKREMDALQFGTLVHRVLQRFGEGYRDLADEKEISSVVMAGLADEVGLRFGERPAPAVRVQIEAARVRLLAFARVQAKEFADGWRIIDVERESRGDLVTGSLPVSGQIDRIEVNGERIRVLDYKTQTGVKKPEDLHFATASGAFLRQAETTYRGKPCAWIDLQLPLYRKIAEGWFPGKSIETAYFVLPADPEESAVIPFTLSGEDLASALSCAEEIASRIARGIYWPPRQPRSSWEDPLGIFLKGGSAAECLDKESIAFLNGGEEP
jgi:ATP-dependent helicase/nuclease subunit B